MTSVNVLVQKISYLQAARYTCAAGGTVLLYDILLTTKDEVRLIWPSRFSLVKVLYFINRYFPVPCLLLGLYHLGNFRGDMSKQLCQLSILSQMTGQAVALIAATWLLVLRVQALYSGNVCVSIALYVAFFSTHAITIIISSFVMADMWSSIAYYKSIGLCATKENRLLAVGYFTPVFCETVLVVLQLWHGYRHTRRIRSIRYMAPLLRTLYADGFMYFVVVVSLRLWTAFIFLFADSSLWYISTYLEFGIISTCVSRLVLHLRAAADSASDSSSDECLTKEAIESRASSDGSWGFGFSAGAAKARQSQRSMRGEFGCLTSYSSKGAVHHSHGNPHLSQTSIGEMSSGGPRPVSILNSSTSRLVITPTDDSIIASGSKLRSSHGQKALRFADREGEQVEKRQSTPLDAFASEEWNLKAPVEGYGGGLTPAHQNPYALEASGGGFGDDDYDPYGHGVYLEAALTVGAPILQRRPSSSKSTQVGEASVSRAQSSVLEVPRMDPRRQEHGLEKQDAYIELQPISPTISNEPSSPHVFDEDEDDREYTAIHARESNAERIRTPNIPPRIDEESADLEEDITDALDEDRRGRPRKMEEGRVGAG